MAAEPASVLSPSAYDPSEIEAVARLLLQDQRVRVVPGAWWSYYPERSEVAYPPNLLTEWPGPRSIGALCHEIAEVLFSGTKAIPIFESFVGWATAQGCDARSATLLLNAVNDLRVNRLYLQQFPGSHSYFATLYRGLSLVPKNDVSLGRRKVGPLPHHVLIDGLTTRWAAELVGEPFQPLADDHVRRALNRLWPSIQDAIACNDLAELSEVVKSRIFPTYFDLLQTSLDELRRAEVEPVDESEPNSSVEANEDEASDDDTPDRPPGMLQGSPFDDEPTEAWVFIQPEQPNEPEERRTTPAPAAPASNGTAHPLPPSAQGSGGITFRYRRGGRRGRTAPTYEEVSYVEAAQRLGPQIDALLNGSAERDGLIAILNRRRFGTIDPWRRPHRRRRGDSGDIDSDHPENLVIEPSIAFLKGQHQARDDSQKDFAHAILLDVSGSVVQSGYQSRKFDQLIDTTVVFCEIHRRLKIPFELIAFSERATVINSFADCQYDNNQIDPTSSYVVKDLGYLVRDMYRAEHGETHETTALRQAIADLSEQRGLKTIFVVTDGISSERPALTAQLIEIEQRNQVVPANESLMVLAFGLGLAEEEFNASYQPEWDDTPIRCASGQLVKTIEALPTIVCDTVDWRIRTA